ncbi:allantoinase, mitochondrial-like isoform X2 [Acanthaster planci]|nr:allantoinase, mitochondrial-like isoform X2 [Acanthaster planci]XP_022085478.1 allantoinase, mitochondrial-like isoform X2 [Acanthaster planci]XP_022085479.1 allantoinase, mitochondrial-like isoform X2 [Acanthaster planci]XP_022085481.1 allantoinase, mitochondrial-like isoform X2 [Acanthaster planci]XP_022085482.1 allantoinase, mitochondrial-like isoform X2 [Acanthaster planci]XP_022085483.1 allantoinase, mitochondrial-like isoform X2 [Acanthaster planci]XP_022085484.1 allantoinase, mitoch
MSSIRVKSRRVLLRDNGTIGPAVVEIVNGKIFRIVEGDKYSGPWDEAKDIDAGQYLVMPGIVDSHVHVNEPGRTEWEGYETATKAAAAGGITTIVDMPLNCIPSTVSLDAFRTKLIYAAEMAHVDVAFWGGVIPGNELELKPMIREGIAGFKCFLIHSGVDEFPHVTEDDLHKAMKELQGTDSVLLFHAEVETDLQPDDNLTAPTAYETFLKSRPKAMENEAIRLVAKLCLQYRVPCHIVHLSSAEALPIILDARKQGAPITVETCHHYLSLDAETVPSGATQFKCCPPIREHENQARLWSAVTSGDIDMIVSDHSPCTADLKLTQEGDFMKAWGGISSLQFGLSLFWTGSRNRGMHIHELVRLMCERTAQLAGLADSKGQLKVGMDGDLVIWDPEAEFQVTRDKIQHRNKLTPYEGKVLKGVVHKTLVRGQVVYDGGRHSGKPLGKLLFRGTAGGQSASPKH